jgi:hypothetical protein
MAAKARNTQAANGPQDGETREGQEKKAAAGQPASSGRPSVRDVDEGAQSPHVGDSAVMPGRFQPGEAFDAAAVTTNPPRGVGEPPANALADEPAARELQEHAQEVIDKEEEQGYRGVKTQVVPNSAYTLQGVGRGDPTPETTVVTPRGADRDK